MAFTEGSTLRHTSKSEGAPALTSMQAAFEGKDIATITPEEIQPIENRFVTDPEDPLVEPAVVEPELQQEVEPSRPLKIDLSKIDLDDELLDTVSLLPGQKMPAAMRPALSQDLELPPMNNALLKPMLEKIEAEQRNRDDLEFVIPERPFRSNHADQHAFRFHELVESRREHPTAAPKPTPFIDRIFRKVGAKEAKLRADEERTARRRTKHQPVHASVVHEKIVEQPAREVKRIEQKPAIKVESAAQTTPEGALVIERRRGSLDFLRSLRKKPEIVNNEKSLAYIDQLFADESKLVAEQTPAAASVIEIPEEAKPEKAPRFERAKKWFNAHMSDIRTYGGLNYFANKWNRPGDWLMNREGGRQKARFNVVLGLTALAVGSKILEGTTGASPFAALHDFDFSPLQGSGHEAALPSVAPYFESSGMTPEANSAVVDGSNQFNLPEVPASVPIEETINNPAFTIESGQTGYALFDKLGLSHEAWNDHAGDLLQFPDFYMEDGDVRLAHEGVLSEEARTYLLDLKKGVEQ